MTQRPKLRLNREPPPEVPAPVTNEAIAKTTKPEPRSAKVPPSREGKKFIGGHFPKSIWDTFRRLGLEHEKSGQDLLQEAMDDLIAKYGKR